MSGATGEIRTSPISPRKRLNFPSKQRQKASREPIHLGNSGYLPFCETDGCRRLRGMDTQDLSKASRPFPTLRVRPSTEDDVGAIAAIYGHHVLHGTASF